MICGQFLEPSTLFTAIDWDRVSKFSELTTLFVAIDWEKVSVALSAALLALPTVKTSIVIRELERILGSLLGMWFSLFSISALFLQWLCNTLSIALHI
jgi:hypothetical protein